MRSGAFDTLATDGVVALRSWRDEDAPAIVEACRDPDVIRWTRVPDPYGISDARQFLEQARRTQHAGMTISAAIADAGTAEYLGSIDLRGARDGRADIGYIVSPGARGRGVATRAVKLLADYGFGELDLGRIEIVTHPENVASQRVAEKAGFVRETLLRAYILLRDGRADGVMFARVNV